MTTLDYDGENAAPRPVSETISNYLRRSISLSDVLGRLLRGWYYALIGALLGVLIGVYMIWITPPSYTVSVTLLPLEAGEATIGGGGGSGLGILSGLMGSSGPVPKFTRFVASFYSVGVAEAMDKKYNMICRTLASCRDKPGQPAKHFTFSQRVGHVIADIAHLPDPEAPRTAVDLARYTQSTVMISSDVNSRMLKLSMTTPDSETAKVFLTTLVKATNDFIKDQDNAMAKKTVDYVTSQLRTNTDLSQRAALTNLLAQQESRLMFTAVDLPYVAAIQEGPIVDVSNASVKFLAAYIMLGLLLGGGMGVAKSFMPKGTGFLSFWRRYWTKP